MTQFQGRAAPVVVVTDGHSFNNVPDPPNNYPEQMMATRDGLLENVGVNGAGWINLDNSLHTRVYPFANCALISVYVMVGGLYDIQIGGTGATVNTRMEAIADLVHAAGFTYVIACTHTPATSFNTEPKETARLDLNAAILANTLAKYDAVVDLAADPLDDYTDLTYFDADQIHLTAAGAAVVASRVGAALDALVAA